MYRMTGFSLLVNDSITPAAAAISIRPTQNDITPIMVMHKEIASLDESRAAFVISGRVPVNVAKIIPIRIIKAHKKLSIAYLHSQIFYITYEFLIKKMPTGTGVMNVGVFTYIIIMKTEGSNKMRFLMSFLLYLSDVMIPLVIFCIVSYGLLQRVDVYSTFIKGARSGFFTVIKIMPTLVGLMTAVGILRASGFLDFLAGFIGKFTKYIGFPAELVPLTIIKMFSSSAATGLLLDIFKEFGTDSNIGKIASISMSCTETIFYTMSVYFLAAKVTKTRYTMSGALISTLAGLVVSVILGTG